VFKSSSYRVQQAVKAVNILETLPIVIIGIVGYVATLKGLLALRAVRTEHISEDGKRRFYENWLDFFVEEVASGKVMN